jgi:hypothetical protein
VAIDLTAITAILVLVLPVISVFAAYRLWSIANRPQNKGIIALRERADTAIILAFASIVTAFLAINRLVWDTSGSTVIPEDFIIFIAFLVAVLTSIPNILWYLRFKRHGFDSGSESE